MRVACSKCQAQISLALDRVPGNPFMMTCPACRMALVVEVTVRNLPVYPEDGKPVEAVSGGGATPGIIPEEPAKDAGAFGATALRELVLKVLQGDREEIPLMNRVALKVRALMQEPRGNAGEISTLVQKDQALASRVMCLANSAYYAGAEPSTNILQALRRVGFKAVETVVLAASSSHLYRPRSAAEAGIMAGLWDHALAVATAAKWISREMGKVDPEETFLNGLMHDIGRVLGLRVLGEAAAGNMQMRKFLTPERIVEFIDVHHTELGGMLLEKWSFPPATIRAARTHHAPGSLSPDDPLDRSRVLC